MRILIFGLLFILSSLVLINCETRKSKKLPNATWSAKIGYIDYLGVENDSLFAVRAVSKSLLQKIRIDKSTGLIKDTVFDKHEQSKDRYAQFMKTKIDLYGCKGREIKQHISPIETIVCRYFLTIGTNGDSIFLETKYKNIRSPENVSHEFIVMRNDIIQQRLGLNTIVYDYVVIDDDVILYCAEGEAYSLRSFSVNSLMSN